MKRKQYLISIAFLLVAVLATACGQGEEVTGDESVGETEENEVKEEVDKEEELAHGRETVEFERVADQLGDILEDQGDPEVWIRATFEEKGDEILIKGESNLVPDSRLFMTALAEEYIFNAQTYARTEKDGSFTAEMPRRDVHDIDVTIEVHFRPSGQNDDVQAVYGELGEELEGDYIYKSESRDGDIEQVVKTLATYRPVEGEDQQFETTKPEWNKPEDYGDLTIRMDVDVEKDDEFYYITVQSNLLENTRVQAKLDFPDYIATGFLNTESVCPDGSVEIRLPILKDLKPDQEAFLNLTVRPSSNSNLPSILEHYGEEGEHFEGELVDYINDQHVIRERLQLQ
ncbi:hypothetical protein [Desertibacillus haloalkaliphilus]|uniref:hypothetical protein n=1 Tax=Desertibacillus haloalkaliphilus TaxID=1328930 RepID=UPI001C2533C0|nr:hypothetical protein [Desertibacillus haloalkaliphilus]MBU8906712.1 hypothetical protein [Desertibacillus haloalkaliphilus]